jgi:hypothetical protein
LTVGGEFNARLCVVSRHDLDAAVMQRLPNTQIELELQAGLLVMQLMRQADAKQVGGHLLNTAFTPFEERTQSVSLSRVSQSEHHIHLSASPTVLA